MNEQVKLPHQLVVNDREQLTVSGVSDVDRFDDAVILAHTSVGDLTIRGEKLRIDRLNIDTGDLSVGGRIDQLEYTESVSGKGGFLGKWFR